MHMKRTPFHPKRSAATARAQAIALIWAVFAAFVSAGCLPGNLPTQNVVSTRADVTPPSESGLPTQSIEGVLLAQRGNDQNINLRLVPGVSFSGTVQIRWTPDQGPDDLTDNDPLHGLGSIVTARQIGGIGFGSVEVLPSVDAPSAGAFRMSLPPGRYDVAVSPTEYTEWITRQVFPDRLVSAWGDTFTLILDRGYPMAGRLVWAEDPERGMPDMFIEAWHRPGTDWVSAGPLTKTDAEGGFALALPEGDYELRCTPDHQAAESPIVPEFRYPVHIPDDIPRLAELSYPRWEVGFVAGQVLDSAGQPLAEVSVFAEGEVTPANDPGASVRGGVYSTRTVTDAGGTFGLSLPYGPAYRLRFVPPPQAAAGARAFDGVEALVVDRPSIYLTEVVLLDKAPIVGMVADPEGRPVVGAIVLASNLDVSGHGSATATDAEGRFHLDIDSGRVSIEVQAPADSDLVSPAPTIIDLTNDGAPLDLVLERGRIISGTVLDPYQSPVPGARVDFRHPETLGLQGSALTDEEGRYQLTIPVEGLPVYTP